MSTSLIPSLNVLNKFSLLLLTLQLMAVAGYSQQWYLPGYTIPAIEEAVAMDTYPAESSASAVYLYDLTYCKPVYRNGALSHYELERRFRIKVLSEEGLDAGSLIIEYREGRRNSIGLANISGATYNQEENGKLQRVELHEESILESNLQDEVTRTVIEFPQVKVGSVIEGSYTLYLKSSYSIPDFSFQGDYPKVYTEYRVEVTPSQFLRAVLQGVVAPDSVLLTEQTIEAFATQVPAVYREPMMPARYNAYGSISILPIRLVWRDFAKEGLGAATPFLSVLDMTEEWEDLLQKPKLLAKELPDEIKRMNPGIDQAISIYDYARSHYGWNGKWSLYPKQSSKELVETKYGNSTEINMALAMLLQHYDYEVAPVAISTLQHGLVTQDDPSFFEFNSIILRLSLAGEDYYLSIVDGNRPFGVLNPMEYNNFGGDMKSLTPVYPREELTEWWKVVGEAHLDPVRRVFEGSWRVEQREIARAITLTEDYLKKTWILESREDFVQTEGRLPSDTSITTLRGEYPVEQTGQFMYVPVAIEKGWSDNPFTAETREHPIYLNWPKQYDYQFTLHIPPGYELVGAPEKVVYNLPNRSGLFFFEVTQSDQKVIVSMSQRLKQALYGVEAYPYFQEMYQLITESVTEMLILEKIEE